MHRNDDNQLTTMWTWTIDFSAIIDEAALRRLLNRPQRVVVVDCGDEFDTEEIETVEVE